MKIKHNLHVQPTSEHIKRVKEAKLELSKRINGVNDKPTASISKWAPWVLVVILLLSIIFGIFWLITYTWQTPYFYFVLVALFIVLVDCCKIYGTIVGGFTFFTGLRLMFSGQYFPVVSALPFTIYNLPLSYFCLGWGLLMASRKTKSKIGFVLGAANLLGGAFGLFQFKHITQIHAPGFVGSLISGILTMILGFSTIKVIVDSYSIKTT